jgi:hypothetical protein
MLPQPLERIPGRFYCDNPPEGADASSDRQSVGSNVGADVDNDCSRRDHMPVGGNHIRLEAAEKEDRKIDAFAKIELPPQAAAAAEGDRASSYRPPSAHDHALGSPSQGDLSFRAQNHPEYPILSAKTSCGLARGVAIERRPPGNPIITGVCGLIG